MLIGKATTHAADGPSVLFMPVPAECAAAWQKELKLAIESSTGAKVSLTRFDESVPQYPNLAGFVRIDGVDNVAPSELRAELNGATARCYAGANTKIPLNNPQFAHFLQLTLGDLRKQTTLPLYLTLDGEQIVVHYNQPLTM
jgi:hypothetical protein